VGDGQIVFTTFHQSFSYEDFIQGISAELNGERLEYRVKSGIFKKLCDEADENPNEKYVLIIDEINRGNISKIFGELITLLEKDKRKGAKEALAVKLPYSQDEDFSVPSNVYVIGTMNTADKSLANVDLALRRRFDFEEMPPKYDLLDGRIVEGVDIRQLLETINQRIEVLIDRDHLIGHSYMLGIDSINGLKKVFEKNIIPLLQEYFYDDWRRIRWVLNDHRKNNVNYQFIRKGGDTTVGELFGNDIVGEVNDRRFYINQEAFGKIESYTGIVNNND
jgi:5-methylcytosine-specific restriction protein B